MARINSTKNTFLLCWTCVAAMATFLLFLTVKGNDFVDLDDLGYIILNQHITTLNWKTVSWAFTSFYEYNWHPLTMLSLAFDYKFWGLDPFGYHLTNIVIHSGSVALSSIVFARLLEKHWGEGKTSFDGRIVVGGAAAAALMFGLHPLRVESVVWASERKDVLCVFFFLLTVWLYLRHAAFCVLEKEKPVSRSFGYWSMLLAASMSMLSKPAAVSLPLVLLLLDWHPLKRLTNRSSIIRALIEKIPLVFMAAATATMTILAQQEPITSAKRLTVLSRILVACKALVFYLQEMIWPAKLAPHYPHPGNVTLSGYSIYFIGILAIFSTATILILIGRRTLPSLWAYYLITLLPMIGIVQVGGQWKADRYTYLPALGVSLFWGGGIAWLCGVLLQKGHRFYATLCLILACCQLISYSIVTLRLIPVWKNTETMTSRVIELIPDKALDVYVSRALFRRDQREYSKAREDADTALILAIKQGRRDRFKKLYRLRAELPFEIGKLPEIMTLLNVFIAQSRQNPPAEYLLLRDQLQSYMDGNLSR